jgi:hypothetical protein
MVSSVVTDCKLVSVVVSGVCGDVIMINLLRESSQLLLDEDYNGCIQYVVIKTNYITIRIVDIIYR